MNLAEFGEQIDIHGGGNDLIFPHHENEIAQSECFTGKQFARYWIHNGMLQLSGEKMSKSLSNIISIEDFLCIRRRRDADAGLSRSIAPLTSTTRRPTPPRKTQLGCGLDSAARPGSDFPGSRLSAFGAGRVDAPYGIHRCDGRRLQHRPGLAVFFGTGPVDQHGTHQGADDGQPEAGTMFCELT
jgi:hypothetical protein